MQSRALFLTFLLISPSIPLPAQTAAPGLAITVLKGEGGQNSIKSRSGVAIEVEVRDDQKKSVAGAQVIFQLPSFGASGSFPGGQLTERTTTGPDGHATMSGFVPNDIAGQFNIKISADSGSLHGTAVVSQSNLTELASDKPKSHKGLWILIAAGAGGAVAAGVLAGSKGGGSSSPAASVPPSVTVSTGTITVGGPH